MTSCDISSSQVGVFGNSQENERLTRPIFHSGFETGKHIFYSSNIKNVLVPRFFNITKVTF